MSLAISDSSTSEHFWPTLTKDCFLDLQIKLKSLFLIFHFKCWCFHSIVLQQSPRHRYKFECKAYAMVFWHHTLLLALKLYVLRSLHLRSISSSWCFRVKCRPGLLQAHSIARAVGSVIHCWHSLQVRASIWFHSLGKFLIHDFTSTSWDLKPKIGLSDRWTGTRIFCSRLI